MKKRLLVSACAFMYSTQIFAQVALGVGAVDTGAFSVAVGDSSTATGVLSTAIGYNSSATVSYTHLTLPTN